MPTRVAIWCGVPANGGGDGSTDPQGSDGAGGGMIMFRAVTFTDTFSAIPTSFQQMAQAVSVTAGTSGAIPTRR